MGMLAVITEDFDFYHDLVRKLKRRRASFVSLGLRDEIPAMVEVVLTTGPEVERLDFEKVISVPHYDRGRTEGNAGEKESETERAIDRALAIIAGKEKIDLMVIGVDPGKRPGLAVMGDATLLKSVQAGGPEEVGGLFLGMVETYLPRSVVLRLGDGAPTQRDRVLRSVTAAMEENGRELTVELVDEKGSSDVPRRSDTEAALKIALTAGRPVWGSPDVEPTAGELRELQERSRRMSEGLVTISSDLARRVAAGEMSMEEAVEAQRNGG